MKLIITCSLCRVDTTVNLVTSEAIFCRCGRNAYHALKGSDVPTDIFIDVSCSNHKKIARHSSASEAHVSLTLCPDTAVSESDGVSRWPVVYHGTAAAVINSILSHGMLLSQNETQIGTRRGTEDQKRAIWTYPELAGAKVVAGTGTLDYGTNRVQDSHKTSPETSLV